MNRRSCAIGAVIALGTLGGAHQALAAAPIPMNSAPMTADGYAGESAGSNGQTNLIGTDGRIFSVPDSVATTLNASRASQGLTTIPAISPDVVRRSVARSRWSARFPFARPFGIDYGNCGYSGIGAAANGRIGIQWATQWGVYTNVTGGVAYFSWDVLGSGPSHTWWKSWSEDHTSSTWVSDTYDENQGKGKYDDAVYPDESYVVGSKSVCYSGGPTAGTTVP